MKLLKVLLWALILILGVTLVIYFFGMKKPEVNLEALERGPVVDAVYATGEVKALIRAEVAPEINGKVTSIHYDVGDTVSNDAVLAEIETNTLEISRQMAEHALSGARARWEKAEKHLDRMKNLYRKNAVTRADLDNARRSAEAAEADYKRQKAGVELESLRVVKAELKSPMAGLVIEKNIEPGEYATTGRPVYTIIDLASLVVVVDVDETEVDKVRAGQSVNVSLDAYPGKRYQGKVRLVVPRIDEISRTGRIRITLHDKPESLKEGMSATVNIITRKIEDALLAPRDAVIIGEEKAWVFTLGPDSLLQKIEFMPGARDEEKVEILSGGLAEGDRVVLGPSEDFETGMEVETPAP